MGCENTEHHPAPTGRGNIKRGNGSADIFPNTVLNVEPRACYATPQILAIVFIGRCCSPGMTGTQDVAGFLPWLWSPDESMCPEQPQCCKCQLVHCTPVGHPQLPPYESPLHPRNLLMLLLFLEGSPLLHCPSHLGLAIFFLEPFSAPPC